MQNLWMAFAVAGGGALGALARWTLALTAQRLSPEATFPLGTAAANLIGCFAAGLCFVWLIERTANPVLRIGVMVGFLGALTTFSTFGLETIRLMADRRYTLALTNIAVSLLLGLAAVWAGIALAKRLGGPA